MSALTLSLLTCEREGRHGEDDDGGAAALCEGHRHGQQREAKQTDGAANLPGGCLGEANTEQPGGHQRGEEAHHETSDEGEG